MSIWHNLFGKKGTAAALLHAHSRQDVELLVAGGADVNARDKYGHTPLGTACCEGRRAVVEALLAAGADLQAESDLTRGRVPLTYACANGHLEIVGLLIEHGADVNAEDHNGDRAIHEAAAKGYNEVVKLLIEHGADLNAAGKYGLPVEIAERFGHEDTAAVLKAAQDKRIPEA